MDMVVDKNSDQAQLGRKGWESNCSSNFRVMELFNRVTSFRPTATFGQRRKSDVLFCGHLVHLVPNRNDGSKI